MYPLKPKNYPQNSSTSMMVLRKQVIRATTSKGKAIENVRGTVPPSGSDHPLVTEDTGSSMRQDRNTRPLGSPNLIVGACKTKLS